MRSFLIVFTACAGGASSGTTPTAPIDRAPGAATRTMRSSDARPAVDAVGALAAARVETGWIVPGPAQLVLGGTNLQPIDDKPLEVDLLDERGTDARVGVRLDHVRFAVWIARSRLMGVLAREQHISASPTSEVALDGLSVALRSGAHVHRLSRKDGYTKVRYIGALEVEGWVPDEALRERGAAGRSSAVGRGFQRTPTVVPLGGMIRADRTVHARVLATAHYTTFVDNVDSLADGWLRVAYSDNDVTLRGYYQQRSAPGATHPAKEPELGAAVVANLTVPNGTCLYAVEEPVGFVMGDQPAAVEPSRVGWFTVTLDTPWGAVAFEARGPTETTLETCGAP